MGDDDITGIFVAAAVAVAVIAVLVFGGLAINRAASPYAEQTRYETRQESQSYKDGIARDFSELCLKLDTATDDSVRGIYADTITRRAQRLDQETVDGLPAETRLCIRNARDIVATGIK